MNFENVNIDDINKKKKELGNFYNESDDINYNLRDDTLRMSLVNVDSEFRNRIPKNITEVNKSYLSEDPITLKSGSNELKIYYPNHGLLTGDTVTLNNVQSRSKTFSNSLYFIDAFSHMLIKFNNHGINKNYKNFVNTLQIESTILTKIEENVGNLSRFYSNIPINMTLGLLTINTFDDLYVDKLINQVQINLIINSFNDIGSMDDIFDNFIFIKLDFPFNIANLNLNNPLVKNNIIGNSIFTIPFVYKISFMNLEGIPLYHINSDYPIVYQRQQGYQEIENVEDDYIYIKTKSFSYSSGSFGGNMVTVSKILKTIPGYPNASEFTIDLKKTFTNVVKIELVSSEIPFIEYTIVKGINSKLYWQNLDDGDKVYSIDIQSGNYSASALISQITTEMNLVKRISSTDEEIVYNIFEIDANTFSNQIKINSFTLTNVPNSITDDKVNIDTKSYYRLTIKHPNNFVEVNDKIEISGASAIGAIPKAKINGEHIIYQVDKSKQTYSIILSPFNESTSPLDPPGNGGLGVIIKTPNKSRFLFNYNDTMGKVLGFRRVGEANSITEYKSEITNLDNYAYELTLDSVGKYNNDYDLFQIDGTTTYWLLYLNDFESVILNGLENCFAKIMITAVQGELSFNSFVNNPVKLDIPATISELNIRMTDKYGNNINFLNYNFSFTLRIYELVSAPRETLLTQTNYHDELLKNIDKKTLPTLNN